MPDPIDTTVPILAFDLGGTKLAAARVIEGKILERRQMPTPADRRPENIIEALLELGSGWIEHVPRIAVAATGHVVNGCVTAPNQHTLPWKEVNLRGELERRSGLPTVVLNDADAAAWGEFCFGAGRGSRRFMFVTVSTGVGAGLVLEGRLLEGAELGFTRLENGTPLEFVASGGALDRYARSRGWLEARDVLERLNTDPGAQEVFSEAVRTLAAKLFDATQLLSLERIVVGGSLGLAPGFLEQLRARGGEIEPAQLGADAGLIGAADWASDLLEEFGRTERCRG